VSGERFDIEQTGSLPLPSFRPAACSPQQVAAPGVAIALPERVPAAGRLPLLGLFALERALLDEFAGPPHAAVGVLVRNPQPAVVNVAEGRLFFRDDVLEEDAFVRGYFNLDLFADFDLAREPALYRVSAFAPGCVSEVLSVEVV